MENSTQFGSLHICLYFLSYPFSRAVMGSGYSNMSMVQFPANSWAILFMCGNRGPCVCLPMCLIQWRHLGWFHPLSFNPKILRRLSKLVRMAVSI
uniref:Uncharacterized protein n=1 Tax=Anguilla anguilla TaxID=7936 RepID=A0A0E9URR5_ANGAN